MKEKKDTKWITISKIRRYKAIIAMENVEGDIFQKKINNVNKKINETDDFIGSKITYSTYLCSFWEKESMEKACKIKLFEVNDFHLIPIKNRGNNKVKDKTVVIRDLPLNVNRYTFKIIMEKIGKVENIKLQVSELQYKAYVIYKNKKVVEEQFTTRWSIFYLKDCCRVASANVIREKIKKGVRIQLS